MHRILRSKRKLENQPEVQNPPKKSRCFSNLTNVKSRNKLSAATPKSANIITNHFNPVPKTVSTGNMAQVKVEKQAAATQFCQSQVSQAALPQTAEDFQMESIRKIRCIKTVLELSLKDVAGVLQLDAIPTFLYDKNQLLNQNPIEESTIEDESMAKNYLSEQRHFQFIHLVRHKMCGRNKVPSRFIIRGILELILVSLIWISMYDEILFCKLICRKFPTNLIAHL